MGHCRGTQRYHPKVVDDEAGLTAAIISYATQYGRYGYRRILALLRSDGWVVNHKRLERIWRQEGLKAPQKQPKRGRLWLTDGSCVRLRPCWPNHVWSYDFVMARTHDGRAFRLLTIIDEYTRECLAIEVSRRLSADAVLYRLTELFVSRRPARLYPVRQRAGVYRQSSSGVAESSRGQNALHRTWQPMGEWLQ
jgi:putative transposase